jgi:hypothetical protein
MNETPSDGEQFVKLRDAITEYAEFALVRSKPVLSALRPPTDHAREPSTCWREGCWSCFASDIEAAIESVLNDHHPITDMGWRVTVSIDAEDLL